MRILADENIPYVADAFGPVGEVETVPAAEIDAGRAADADCLLVRSVTKVNESLLGGSRVRFVATATIGVDHIDRDFLARREIGFASAPGSNANSVSEWVTAAILEMITLDERRLSGLTLGIVGVGNVGRRVEAKARALGMRVLRNDPPRARAEGPEGFVDLDTVLREADIVTTHTPLTREGPDRTAGLAGADFFAAMKPGALYLNSSRGGVVDEEALRAALAGGGGPGRAVLDVWAGEPAIDRRTLAAAAIGTPHIAGYSFDGKVAGTRMIYEAARAFFGWTPEWDPAPLLPEPEVPRVRVETEGRTDEAVLRELVSAVYAIRADDARLRDILDMEEADGAAHFTRLRKEYPRRREFGYTTAELTGGGADLLEAARGLGFGQVLSP